MKKLKSLSASFALTFVLLFSLLSLPVSSNLVSAATVSPKTSAVQSTTKVTAVVDNKKPKQYSTIHVTVTGTARASVRLVCHYKTTDTTYTGSIASNGKAVIPIKISRAAKGYTVVIDVSVKASNKTYTTKTSFTPQ